MRLPSLILFAAAPCALAAGREWTQQWSVSGNAEIVARVDDGRVDIRRGSTPRIEARVVTEGWEIGPDGVRVEARQTGDRVDLEVRIPKNNWREWSGNRSVRVELVVPVGVRADVKTGDGDIRADGVSGVLRFGTGDGTIDAVGLDGSLDAGTGDGNIKVRGRLDALRLRTGDGEIEVDIAAGSKMSDSWDVRTGDGSVTIRLPDGFAADLDVETGDGHLTLDVPVTVIGKLRENGARGKLNGGGQVLAVHTGDGSIRIGRL